MFGTRRLLWDTSIHAQREENREKVSCFRAYVRDRVFSTHAVMGGGGSSIFSGLI